MIDPLSLSLVGLYFLLLIGIGFWLWKKETLADFLIADRKLNAYQAGGSWIATWFDAPLMFLAITIAFTSLGGVIWLFSGIILGLFIFIVYGPKLRSLAAKSNSYTYPSLIHDNIGFSSGIILSLLATFSWFGIAAIQFIAGALILEQLSGIGYEYGVLLMGLAISVYMYLGGFKASVITDVIQISFLFIICCILFFIGQKVEVGSLNLVSSLKEETGAYIWGMFTMIFAVMFSADGIPRMLGAQSEKSARNCVWIAIIGFILLFTFFGYLGYTASIINPSLNPDDAPIWVFTEYLPEQFFPLALIALFGLIMSSADTYILVTAQSLTTDFLGRLNLLNDKRPRFNIRWGIIGVTIASMTLALLYQNVVDFFLMILLFVGIGAPALIALMHNMNKNPYALAISCGLAFTAHVVLLMTGHLTEQASVFINVANFALWFTLEKTAKSN